MCMFHNANIARSGVSSWISRGPSSSALKVSSHAQDAWPHRCDLPGFLDGGDRIMQLDERASSVQGTNSGSEASHLAIQYDQSGGKDNTLPLFGTSLMPTSVLLVTNLPTVLFSQVLDLDPLPVPLVESRISKCSFLPLKMLLQAGALFW
jgi:hypothetical protein